MDKTDIIIFFKIKKAVDFVCPLFKENIISEAYVVGPIAKGNPRDDTEIDIYLLSPKFENKSIDLRPVQSKQDHHIKELVDFLKKRGVIFEAKKNFWHQYYKGDFYRLSYSYEFQSVVDTGNYIRITKDLCY